jgi:hypothetical protein
VVHEHGEGAGFVFEKRALDSSGTGKSQEQTEPEEETKRDQKAARPRSEDDEGAAVAENDQHPAQHGGQGEEAPSEDGREPGEGAAKTPGERVQRRVHGLAFGGVTGEFFEIGLDRFAIGGIDLIWVETADLFVALCAVAGGFKEND